MTQSKIWISTPHLGGTELHFVQEAIHTNWMSLGGPNTEAFEEDLSTFLDQDTQIAALSSGTAALHLGLLLLGVKPGDEVLCQSMTFAASAYPITYVGATPIFIDSEMDTWNMCPEQLEKAIIDRIDKGKKPKAIIAVHLYGMPFKVNEIQAVAQKYEIPLLEDAAEALGSKYQNQACGTFGDLAVLSFNGNKIITTSGGGALVCKDEITKNKAVFLATQARDQAPHYQHSEIGYNYRMSNICAGIGRGQMEVLPQRIEQRRAMHFFYKDLFSTIKKVELFEEPADVYHSNHWLSAILLESFDQREALRLHLEKDNIESRPLWKPMHLQPVFAKATYYGGKVAEHLFERGLCLPSGSNLALEEKGRINYSIQSFFNVS